MPKPALGKVAVGDTLLVIEARYYRSTTPLAPVEAVVEKVGRVWVELRAANDVRSQAKRWRLRLGTQDDGSQGNYRDRFLTADQYEWEQRMRAARHVLFDTGIELRGSLSPWRTDEDRLFALAEFVAAYDAEHPTDPAA